MRVLPGCWKQYNVPGTGPVWVSQGPASGPIGARRLMINHQRLSKRCWHISSPGIGHSPILGPEALATFLITAPTKGTVSGICVPITDGHDTYMSISALFADNGSYANSVP